MGGLAQGWMVGTTCRRWVLLSAPSPGIRTLVALWGPNGEVLVTVDTWSGEIRAEAVFQLVQKIFTY